MEFPIEKGVDGIHVNSTLEMQSRITHICHLQHIQLKNHVTCLLILH